MDPLSVAASVIAVVGAAKKAAQVITLLKTLKNAPEELQELVNEVSRVEAILEDVNSACDNGRRSTAALDLQVQRADAKLLELQILLQYDVVRAKDPAEIDRVSWVRRQGKINNLHKQLSAIRQDITLVLAAANYSQSGRIDVEMQQLVACGTQTAERQEVAVSMLATQQDQLKVCASA